MLKRALEGFSGFVAAFAFGDVAGEVDFHGEGVAAVDAVDQDFGGGFSHFFYGDMYGGQHGGEVLGSVDVVDADYGYISGDFQAFVFDGAQGADGSDVVSAEDGCQVRALL